uniref:Baculoviral IAP repeat containing 5a n=1 Tax=Gasterosteus aculeatus aculeatus TaxID=481459 RepID=G3P5A3_GASAC
MRALFFSFDAGASVREWKCVLSSSKQHVVKTKMARAGFIHTPSGNSPDIAMCFFCLKELEGWEPEDDPEKEHKSHSASCHFMALKKKVEDLTVEEFFKLQKERHKFIINKSCNETITKFEEAAKLRRAEIIKTAVGEE